jgi:hypothetical protein
MCRRLKTRPRAHLTGIGTEGASPRRMVILIWITHVQSQVLWIDRLVESSSSKNVSLYTIHKSNKQFDWNRSGTKTGQAYRYALRWFFFLYIIYLIIVVSECVSNGTKRKLPTGPTVSFQIRFFWETSFQIRWDDHGLTEDCACLDGQMSNPSPDNDDSILNYPDGQTEI